MFAASLPLYRSPQLRQIEANYRGEPVYLRPDRGAAVPRDALKDGAYRGRDDERWLVPAARLPRDAAAQ